MIPTSSFIVRIYVDWLTDEGAPTNRYDRWTYAILEKDGKLRWQYHTLSLWPGQTGDEDCDVVMHQRRASPLPVGNMDGSGVMREHMEAVTGLHWPAAEDRIREVMYSKVDFTPEDV